MLLMLLSGCGASQEAAKPAETEAAETETTEAEAAEAEDETVEAEAETEEAEAAETETAETAGVEIDYSQETSWAYCETGTDEKAADVFFICPTVYGGTEDAPNMSMEDEDTKESFLGAVNMEKGIYDEDCRFFAPYYRQIGLSVYELPAEDREEYLDTAYEDVEDAFFYYYEHYNEGRPIVLAGFSQGAELSLRLLEECFD